MLNNKTGHNINGPKMTEIQWAWRNKTINLGGDELKLSISVPSFFGVSAMVPQALSVPASASFAIASRSRTPSHVVFSHRFIFTLPNSAFSLLLFFPIIFHNLKFELPFHQKPLFGSFFFSKPIWQFIRSW